jgi:predicted lipoprotein with Yx(FWY)xxD motif
MRRIVLLLVAGVLVAAGCGDDDSDSGSADTAPAQEAATQEKETTAATTTEADAEPEPARARGTTVKIDDSEFGPMLFSSKNQAIYIFQNDRKDRSVCYGECAVAWPPVYTKGAPRAGKGVRKSLLGTIKRRDGKRQVTYAGKPLYYYVNEGPGEVRCHNVNLNGGLWWVVGPNGKRRP